jgi:hypothetical protein
MTHREMPGLLTRSNAAAARFTAVMTFVAAYAAFASSELLSAFTLAAAGIALWVLTGDPYNHGALRRVSGGVIWMVLLILGVGFGLS